MKKKLSLLIVLVLILSLAFTGCGKKDPTPEIQAQATTFLDAMANGDLDTIAKCADPAILEAGGDLDSFGSSLDTFADDLIESIGTINKEDISDDALQAIEAFKTFVIDNLVVDYELGAVTVDGETATVEATVNYGFDPDKLGDVNVDTELQGLLDTYMAENLDELVAVLSNDGEEALQIKIINDLIGDILTLYGDAVVAQGGISEDSVLFMENVDGTWLVTQFKAKL